jgi:hypothetical protein
MLKQIMALIRTKRQTCVNSFLQFIEWLERSGPLPPRAALPRSSLAHSPLTSARALFADPLDVIIDGANVGYYKNRPSVSNGRINFAQISRSAPANVYILAATSDSCDICIGCADTGRIVARGCSSFCMSATWPRTACA